MSGAGFPRKPSAWATTPSTRVSNRCSMAGGSQNLTAVLARRHDRGAQTCGPHGLHEANRASVDLNTPLSYQFEDETVLAIAEPLHRRIRGEIAR
jgi:hypothetical protein